MQKSYIRNKNLVTDIEKVLLDYNAVLFGDYELAIEKYLAKDNYEGAVKKYNTLMSLYKTFGDKEKKDILEKINVIYGKIKLYSLLTKLVDYSKNGEINNIKLVLSSISELEPGLVAEFKDIDLKIKIQTKIDYLKQHLKKTYGLDIKIDELEEKTTMIENCLAKNSVESAKNIFNELKQKLASKNRFSTLIKDTEAKIMIYQKLIELTSKMENITEKTIILKDIEDIESCYNDITSKIQSKELKQSLNEKYMLLKGYKLALR